MPNVSLVAMTSLQVLPRKRKKKDRVVKGKKLIRSVSFSQLLAYLVVTKFFLELKDEPNLYKSDSGQC